MSFSAKQGDNLRRLRNSPVCIICGRPQEAEVIAKSLGIFQNRLRSHQVAEIHSDHTFYYGDFILDDGTTLNYVLTSSTRQGVQSFTVQAALLTHILRPKFLVHAGVCAGRQSGKIKLGDVILGESAFNFEEGKFEVVDGEVVFLPDYHQINVHAGDMQAFADDDSKPGYHYGDYITGSAVRKDAPIIFDLISKQVGRNILALDMEASAFLELCTYFSKESTCLGIVKGVSDFGDDDKNSSHKQKALENTAKALKDWIITSIPEKTWEDDYSREPAAEIVPGYYDNFIKRVMDNVSSHLPVTQKPAPGQSESLVHIDVRSIKGLKIILPKNNNPVEYKENGPISDCCRKYNIIEVETGAAHGKRSLYYADGYLIDWPRTLNRYSESYDAKHQVLVFGDLLKKKAWFHGSAESLRASIVSWDDFTSWLDPKPVQSSVIFEEPIQNEPVSMVESPEKSPSLPPRQKPVIPFYGSEPRLSLLDQKQPQTTVANLRQSPSPPPRSSTTSPKEKPAFAPKPVWLRKESLRPFVPAVATVPQVRV